MCCFALVPILIFAAAFPLFNNVDEQFHYEMVYRFAHGYMPEKELPRIHPENSASVYTLWDFRIFHLTAVITFGAYGYTNCRTSRANQGDDHASASTIIFDKQGIVRGVALRQRERFRERRIFPVGWCGGRG